MLKQGENPPIGPILGQFLMIFYVWVYDRFNRFFIADWHSEWMSIILLRKHKERAIHWAETSITHALISMNCERIHSYSDDYIIGRIVFQFDGDPSNTHAAETLAEEYCCTSKDIFLKFPADFFPRSWIWHIKPRAEPYIIELRLLECCGDPDPNL